MASVEMTRQALTDAARALEGGGPVQMVNLLRFRDQAKSLTQKLTIARVS